MKAENKTFRLIFKELSHLQAWLNIKSELNKEFQVPKVAFQ